MVLPGSGVLPVVRGTADEGTEVWGTVDEPRRWFVVCRGVGWAKGVSAQVLWEVDADLDLTVLSKMLRKGQSNPAGVRHPYLDVDVYCDRSDAEASLRGSALEDARITRALRDRTFPMRARTVTGHVEFFDVTVVPVLGADEWMMRPVGWTPRRLKKVEAFGLPVRFPGGRPPVDHRGPVRVHVRLQGPKDRFVELDLLPPAGRVGSSSGD
ncbi:hypothetical protein MWU57_01090 [Isoptericola sp. S6320L]|uniref:hypothetical protein n=1 Tax=Isoptericola sp. S6320L TaxID=2926411 RepID=UPI001FF699D1|nr:hypothetical protein [Isoptericola sp. S6320L]MCK0115613.1 hypothetical protein [Isoptericola sp. S6320L]